MFAGTSCDKEEVGGTATEAMAGQWYVTMDGVDDNGQPLDDDYLDFFGDGLFFVNTYNTSANDPTKMFIEELGDAYLGFYTRINAIPGSLEFATDGEVENLSGRFNALTITDGKILLGAGHQNNGSPCDSIVFYVSFAGDPFPGMYGHSKYRVSGIRYSGLAEND